LGKRRSSGTNLKYVDPNFSTLPPTSVPEIFTLKVEELSVDAFMGSLNATETVALTATEVTPSGGLTLSTNGATVSVRTTPVEKEEST
jgi:hypothetical protein